jgi:hypothetical protein
MALRPSWEVFSVSQEIFCTNNYTDIFLNFPSTEYCYSQALMYWGVWVDDYSKQIKMSRMQWNAKIQYWNEVLRKMKGTKWITINKDCSYKTTQFYHNWVTDIKYKVMHATYHRTTEPYILLKRVLQNSSRMIPCNLLAT